MGYFSNGSEGDGYYEAYCARCIHNDENGPYCPVWDLHKRHNYDECNKPDSFLHKLIPRSKDGGHNVPIANLPYIHVSDAAHALCKGEPFAGCYWDTPKGRVFGLRSTDAGLDVSEIAKQYGGGGHRNAAGFTASYDTARTFETSNC